MAAHCCYAAGRVASNDFTELDSSAPLGVLSRTPAGPLGAHVATIWYFEGPGLPHRLERMVPTAAMQIVVNLDRDELRWSEGSDVGDMHRLRGAAVAGPFCRSFVIPTDQQRAVTGVQFHPGGAWPLLRTSARELANDHVTLDALYGFTALRDDLLRARAAGPDAVLDAWQRHLVTGLKRARARSSVPTVALQHLSRGLGVQATADVMSISVRKLRQDFTAAVGLSPQTFARVHRVQRLTRAVARLDAAPVWAQLALDAGYYDQAHMIREFRSLVGVTPRGYRPRHADDANHAIVD